MGRTHPPTSSLISLKHLALSGLAGLVLLANGVSAATASGESGGHASTILGGGDNIDPTVPNPAKPIVLIVIQLCLIIALARLLGFFFGKARQPRVVSEILAGILLGPTAFGQIPHFTEHIFPQSSITYLTLLSEIGLVLFLFCVGMEADMGLLRRNFRPAMSVSLAGLAIPFGIGCAVSVGLFGQFGEEGVKFTTFMTFIGTSSSITALPVLARILGELQLMQDKVGLVALAAGVVNDVIGWALLALSIALANAGKGVVVVYILLTLVGWMLFLFFACRPALVYCARVTGSYGPAGPTQNFVCACLVVVFASAFFCEVIGISAIFGGFLAGLIIPAEFAHPLTARIEDLVSSILVPLYFATSGLSTNLTLLNSGIIWAWTICVIICAFCGKFIGCAIAARLSGFGWRESGATGSLMSAKGLIELIVLNQGLQAGIISETVFSIFVLEALVLTIAATPLTLLFYPARIRTPTVTSPAHGHAGPVPTLAITSPEKGSAPGDMPFKPRTRFTIVLDQLESLGSQMLFAHLFSSSSASTSLGGLRSEEMQRGSTGATSGDNTVVGSEGHKGDVGLASASSGGETETSQSPAATPPPAPQRAPSSLVSLIPIRLVELTDRTSSSLLAAASSADLLRSDALTALFRTFSSLLSLGGAGGGGVKVEMAHAELRVEQQENWAEVVARKASEDGAEGVVVGWKIGGHAAAAQAGGEGKEEGLLPLPNPFSHLFPTTAASPSALNHPSLPHSSSSSNLSSAPRFAAFLRSLFLEASCDVSVLIDRSSSSSSSSSPSATPSVLEGGAETTLTIPFFGGADDRAALELALQLVLRSPSSTRLRVLVIERAAEETAEDSVFASPSGGTLKELPSSSSTAGKGEAADELAHKLGQQYGLTVSSQTQAHGQTHYPTTAHRATVTGGAPSGLASETADSVLLAHVEGIAATLPAGAVTVERARTAHPLRTMLRLLSTPSAGGGGRSITLLGRSRRDAPSHRLESLSLLAAAGKDGRLQGSVVSSGEVRRAVGEPASAVLLGAGGEGQEEGWVWVVQSRYTAGRRAARKGREEDA
ncbi:hypothetical protein JCM10213_003452 [Rhodosporidiobolus nylandii]